MCDQQSLRPACAYAQSDQSLCLSLEYSMIVKLLTERHLEFLSLKGGCTGSSESTLVKMSNCWKSHALAQLNYFDWNMTIHHKEAPVLRRKLLKVNTSTNLLQNAAKMMHGENTPLLALYKPNFTFFSSTPFQRLVFTIYALSFGFEHKHCRYLKNR